MNPPTKRSGLRSAHLLRSALILLSLLALCLIPFAVAQWTLLNHSSLSVEPPAFPPGWSSGAPLPMPAIHLVGVHFPANGKFYAMGGGSLDTCCAFTHPFEYDVVSNTWTTKSATYSDNQVWDMACGVLAQVTAPFIYCVGGRAPSFTTATARVFYYDPVSDTLTYLTSSDNWPGNASGTVLPGGFSVYNNKLYILGGFNINVASTNQIWQFDPTAAVGAKWTQMTNAPLGIMYAPTCTIGNTIYVAGASDFQGGAVVDTTHSFSFNPGTNTIGTIAPIPRATGETRGLTFTFNGKMLVMGGGRVAPNPSNEVDAYDPGTNTWTVNSPVPAFMTARRNFATDTDGIDHIWLAGGYAPTSPTTSVEIFVSSASPTPTPTPTPTPPLGCCQLVIGGRGSCVDGITEAQCFQQGGVAWLENGVCRDNRCLQAPRPRPTPAPRPTP